MKKALLNVKDLSELKQLSIGKRVKYIRETLRKKFGNDFSVKSVTQRINLFSRSTLTAIEKGNTKDIYSTYLHGLAKDFGVSLYVFFDDYYDDLEKSVELAPNIYNTAQAAEKSINKNRDLTRMTVNPLFEKEYRIKTTVTRIASNDDEQDMFIYTSKTKLNNERLFTFLSTIINQTNSNDVLIDPDVSEKENLPDPLKLAKEYLNYGNHFLDTFPWHSKKGKDSYDNQAYEDAIVYTQKLKEDYERRKEDE
ncbi:hypothetical protein N781_00375 [Pontibacillus halophilus JSM 076056 = DSM 19796]|uniref:Uncharacterized protein n=1 Tax=Pontibacillus halophilus JSM 076056 = DSM 19796 TaxID=1385510 RepID=A0A0A5GS45_9BACI|nr:hypothetical protein [Pontibacillus halophilus]KGX94043.1 hypothetical protein N781_00375 [Pontibacillus halophilus JSM 076056 = DSM 19796]